MFGRRKSLFDLSSLFGFESPKMDYDWEELKKSGIVETSREEKNGYVIVTNTYTSTDGETKIISTQSYPIGYEDQKEKSLKLKDIEKQLEEAINSEDFELAAKLRDQRKTLSESK
jgi:protein-arginine kinase activator protein McsA